jgi:hypothetical protein
MQLQIVSSSGEADASFFSSFLILERIHDGFFLQSITASTQISYSRTE